MSPEGPVRLLGVPMTRGSVVNLQLVENIIVMEKYQILIKAGSGNFSDVYKARNTLTDQVVAIKEMKNSDDLEDLTNKELQILSQLNHPNIIKVKEVIKQKHDTKVVFEFMDETLLQLYQSSKLGINENQIKCILFQAAFALEYLHKSKIIHRDIKPENLLINRKLALIKLIDFGLAKEEYLASTDYVATRWYRAPENLLGLRNSSTAMDIFALACVAVELFNLNPLFPGDNTIDQIYKITSILGSPTSENWPEGFKEAKRKGIMLSSKPPVRLKIIMPSASDDLVNLLEQMLQLNPMRRPTAREILDHPFFEKVERVIPDYINKEAKKAREEYQSRKARKISPINYLSSHETIPSTPYTSSSPGSFYNKQSSKYMTTNRSNDSADKNSRSSPDTKSNLREHKRYDSNNSDSRKHFPQYCELKQPASRTNNYTDMKMASPSGRLDSREKEGPRVQLYFSKDHYHPNPSLSVEKRSPYSKITPSRGEHYVIKTMGDEVRFNARGTIESNKSLRDDQAKNPQQFLQSQQPQQSPRYNVKYFKESPNDVVNRTGRNKSVGMSLEAGYLNRNKAPSSKIYASNFSQHNNISNRNLSNFSNYNPSNFKSYNKHPQPVSLKKDFL